MNRTPHSSDNLFLRGHANLRRQRLRLPGMLMLLALVPLCLMFILVLWFGQFQLQRDIAREADQTGSELARQIATLVADPLAANDHLSLNIILAQWAQSPMIAHTSLQTPDKRVVAEAGRRASAAQLAPGQGRFVAAVHYQDDLVGQLHLSLARAPFAGPIANLIQSLLWSLALLIIIAGLLAWRLGLGMRQVLSGLGNWYANSETPPPGYRRQDELGDLARRLAERRITDLPPLPVIEPEPEPEPEMDEPTLPEAELTDADIPEDAERLIDEGETGHDERVTEPTMDTGTDATETASDKAEVTATTSPEELLETDADSTEHLPAMPINEKPATPASTVLAVRLGNQHVLHRLPRARLLALLEDYREQLELASKACQGQLYTLQDGTSLIFFHPDGDKDQLGDALCCGELLRALGHELQTQIADTGIVLHVQIALCHTACEDIQPDELKGQSAECAQMLEQIQHSRNLLLLDASLATHGLASDKAVMRRLASQPDIYWVERLKAPYQSQLELLLTKVNTQRGK